MKKHLVIFVKAPRMGAVKTRLAKGIGNVPAWRFYKNTVSSLIKRLRSDKWTLTLYISPDDYKGTFFPKDINKKSQGRGNLGTRMQRAFDEMEPGRMLLIGGDIPAIEKKHIKNAFKALQTNDFTLGPSEDGGYWLVGMRRSRKRLKPFGGVRWSTENTMQDTLSNLDGDTRHVLVDTLNDVDTVDDL